MSSTYHGKDFYKILRVSHTASVKEIKTAYYRIALELHPDKHNGCVMKLESFKQVNEAYNILSDQSKRSEYDFKLGLRFNTGRRTAPPKDYRKVYTSRPPPHWKTTWDHVKHQEMHYGDGMQKEAIRQAKKTAEKEGAFDYHSPLGKGFTFTDDNDQLNGVKYNPYSKRTPQGPPKIVFDYQEGSNLGGREQIFRHERIVQDLHSRRSDRRHRTEEILREEEQRYGYAPTSPYAQYSTRAAAAGTKKNSPDDCIIL